MLKLLLLHIQNLITIKNTLIKEKIISFKTSELVDNSEFVITKYSSGLSYAVLSKKPILFFYTNEHKNFEDGLR